MAATWSLSRVMLWCLIVALSASGLLGIGVFLFAEFNDLSGKILCTTLGVSFYSLMALGCAAALEKRRAKVVALPGLAVCAAGFLYLMVFIWFELFDLFNGGESWKAVPILAIFAASLAQACLLSFVRLRHSLSWLGWTAHTAIFWLATLIAVMIVFELDDEWLMRAAGVLAIVDGCMSLTIPILARLGGAARATSRSAYSRIEITCPQCDLRQSYPPGQIECEQCGLKLRVEVFGPTVPLDDPPFQFSVRSLLILTFIVAAGLGLLNMRLGPVFGQWDIARSLGAVGGEANFSGGYVHYVTFSGPAFAGFADEHAAMLGKLPKLYGLNFRNVAIDAATISRISIFENNGTGIIEFDQVRFPNHGLGILGKKRPVANSLRFVKTPLALQDIAAMDGCNASCLTLRETGLTDEGLAHLKSWPRLAQLDLGEPKITKAGLMRLKDLPNLNSLTLAVAPGDKIDKEVATALNAAWPNVNVHARDR